MKKYYFRRFKEREKERKREEKQKGKENKAKSFFLMSYSVDKSWKMY